MPRRAFANVTIKTTESGDDGNAHTKTVNGDMWIANASGADVELLVKEKGLLTEKLGGERYSQFRKTQVLRGERYS